MWVCGILAYGVGCECRSIRDMVNVGHGEGVRCRVWGVGYRVRRVDGGEWVRIGYGCRA